MVHGFRDCYLYVVEGRLSEVSPPEVRPRGGGIFTTSCPLGQMVRVPRRESRQRDRGFATRADNDLSRSIHRDPDVPFACNTVKSCRLVRSRPSHHQVCPLPVVSIRRAGGAGPPPSPRSGPRRTVERDSPSGSHSVPIQLQLLEQPELSSPRHRRPFGHLECIADPRYDRPWSWFLATYQMWRHCPAHRCACRAQNPP